MADIRDHPTLPAAVRGIEVFPENDRMLHRHTEQKRKAAQVGR